MSDFYNYDLDGFDALIRSKKNNKKILELEQRIISLEINNRYLNDLVRKMMQEIEELRKS